MELEVKANKRIEDGKHKGVISRIEYRTEPFEYTDVYINMPEEKIEVKYGCPTNLSEQSKLGRLLTSLRVKLEVGKKVDIDKELVGKAVEFMTIVRRTKEGKEFAEIVEDSIKSIL